MQFVLDGDPDKDDPVTIAYREISHISDLDLGDVYLVEGFKINGVVYLPIDWSDNLSGQSVAEWADNYLSTQDLAELGEVIE